MSNMSPKFSILEPQHFSVPVFDPQIDSFQVLEEGRKRKRQPFSRAIEESCKKIKKSKRHQWWRNAILFFRKKWSLQDPKPPSDIHHRGRSLRGSISGPLYITESRISGPRTPSWTSRRPLAGTVTPTRKGEMIVPYVSLRELNIDQQHRISASPLPIYFVS